MYNKQSTLQFEAENLAGFRQEQGQGQLCERGFALPLAMLLLLVIAASTAIFSRQAQELFAVTKNQEVASDNLYRSEGVLYDTVRQMAQAPELWSNLPPLSELPSSYSFFQPGAYTSTNGIPDCSGKDCHRNMIPIGGAIIKNVGPLAGDGQNVDSAHTMQGQLDPQNLPEGDITLNGRDVWVQVERIGKRLEPVDAVGSSLDSNDENAGNAQVVQYRVSGYSLREVKGKLGRSVVVAIVEVPPV